MTLSEIINPWGAVRRLGIDLSRRTSELAFEEDRVNLLERRLETLAAIQKNNLRKTNAVGR
jgi:hypothetical protein